MPYYTSPETLIYLLMRTLKIIESGSDSVHSKAEASEGWQGSLLENE